MAAAGRVDKVKSKPWIPSAPLVGPKSRDFFSEDAARVIPYTHWYLCNCVVNPKNRADLVEWMSDTYRRLVLNQATRRKPFFYPIMIRTPQESLRDTMWFTCVYLGRLFVSKKIKVTYRHDSANDEQYTCALIDPPYCEEYSSQRYGKELKYALRWKGAVAAVGTLAGPGILFQTNRLVDVGLRQRLLIEMPVVARLLYDSKS